MKSLLLFLLLGLFSASESSQKKLVGLIGPSWTRGLTEAPRGRKDMGSWVAAYYDKDQQARLGVNLFGKVGRDNSISDGIFGPKVIKYNIQDLDDLKADSALSEIPLPAGGRRLLQQGDRGGGSGSRGGGSRGGGSRGGGSRGGGGRSRGRSRVPGWRGGTGGYGRGRGGFGRGYGNVRGGGRAYGASSGGIYSIPSPYDDPYDY